MNKFGHFQRLVGLCAAAALATSLATAAPQTGSAKVTAVKGSATFAGQPAQVGAVGGPGTVVTTSAGSEVTLYLGINGPAAKVLENSSLSIDDLTYDTAGSEPVVSTKFGLSKGKIEAYVRKTSAQSSYLIQTPTTTASIRGTTFTVYSNGSVLVWDGCADVTYRDPVSGREVKYNVCKGQMFDANVAAVLEIPPGIPAPVVGSQVASSASTPVGPIISLSPVTGTASGNYTGGNDNPVETGASGK